MQRAREKGNKKAAAASKEEEEEGEEEAAHGSAWGVAIPKQKGKGKGRGKEEQEEEEEEEGAGEQEGESGFCFWIQGGWEGGRGVYYQTCTHSLHTHLPLLREKKKNNTRQHNNRAPRRFRRAGVGAHRPQPPQNPRLRLPAPGRLGRVSRLIMLCVSACKSVCVCVTIPSPLPKHHHHHRSNSSSTHSPPPPKKTHPPPPPNIITTTLTSPPPPQQQHGAPPPRAGQQLPRDLPPRPGREDLHQGLHARRTGPPVRILSVGSLCVCVSLVGVLCVLCVCACVRAAVRPWDFIRERESGGGPQPPNPPKPNTAPPKMTQVGRPCPGPQLRRCPPRLGLQPPSQGKVHVMIAVVCLLPILLPR